MIFFNKTHHFIILLSLTCGLITACDNGGTFKGQASIQTEDHAGGGIQSGTNNPIVNGNEDSINGIGFPGNGETDGQIDPVIDDQIGGISDPVNDDPIVGISNPDDDDQHEEPADEPIVERPPLIMKDHALCLGAKGNDKKILFVEFYRNPHYEKILSEITSRSGINFVIRGAPWDSSTEKMEIQNINNGIYDAVWIFSTFEGASPAPITDRMFDVIKQRNESGDLGLMLFSDNSPSIYTANKFFQSFGWDLRFHGNYPGLGYLVTQGSSIFKDRLGLALDHPINSGLNQKISEGITTSQLIGSFATQINPVLHNTGGGILSATYHQKFFSGKERRVFMHGGFTSLQKTEDQINHVSVDKFAWDSSELPSTAQFFTNAACWSTGAE